MKMMQFTFLLTALIAVGIVMPKAAAQIPDDMETTFKIEAAPVVKVFSAEEDGHRFVAYLVEWKGKEVIVSDPLARSHFQKGDRIRFMAQKVALPGAGEKVSSLNFTLLDTTGGRPGDGPEGAVANPGEQERLTKISEGDLEAVTNEEERFYALNRAAKNAFANGDVEKAGKLAMELKDLATKYRDDWNYGNAIQDSNQVLGLIALGKGEVGEAKKLLLASADSKGSPQMNSFGPNMRLAKSLLEKKETDVVLEYFAKCDRFWEMGHEKIAAWTATVKSGKVPKFGGNLDY